MFSRNEWVVMGKVVECNTKKRGCFITVTGNAINGKVFVSDNFTFNCWISNRVLGNKKIGNKVRLFGRFKFEKSECYFITDKIA